METFRLFTDKRGSKRQSALPRTQNGDLKVFSKYSNFYYATLYVFIKR